ncbi:rRNA maturation endonuclease Nob1 [Cytobacillus purgationiresistens]|uniref:rRNA maturation endonuclease Nob1 n=1 Tax=Cytobacillus purgationiresistens TaxID=863449 RepID=A0ABU0ACZ8_9BACI|nr:rRNA maturation endonuclease Nob1 [Cytobacillus purgationiresistens]
MNQSKRYTVVNHYNKYYSFLDRLPRKKLKCKTCGHKSSFHRGKIRFAKKYYDGPFCAKCGTKIKKGSWNKWKCRKKA